jgi:hypothetical protein
MNAMSDEMQYPHTTENALRRLSHARQEADAYLDRNPDEGGIEVTISLTAREWGFVIDALYRAQSSMKWDARKMAVRFASDGYPFDTEMTELTMMYVESKRWRRFADAINDAVIFMTLGHGELENDDE